MVNGNISLRKSETSSKNGYLRLPKVGEVSVKIHRKIREGGRIKSVTVSSEGNRAQMPHFYRNTAKKLGREQRKLSKMQKGSSN